jgi:hypothetical protein
MQKYFDEEDSRNHTREGIYTEDNFELNEPMGRSRDNDVINQPRGFLGGVMDSFSDFCKFFKFNTKFFL